MIGDQIRGQLKTSFSWVLQIMIGIEEFKCDGREGREWHDPGQTVKGSLWLLSGLQRGWGKSSETCQGTVARPVGAWSRLEVWVAVVGTGCFWPERLVVNSGSVQQKTKEGVNF